jgi:hypothetical protein
MEEKSRGRSSCQGVNAGAVGGWGNGWGSVAMGWGQKFKAGRAEDHNAEALESSSSELVGRDEEKKDRCC